jgi:heat shock protein HslJ
MRQRSRFRGSAAKAAAVFAVLGLIAAACGDSGLPDQSFPDPGPPAPDSSASAPAAAAPLFDPTPDDQTLETPPELAGTSWLVDTLAIESGMTNPWPGTELTLIFGSDGTLSGSAGCNTYLGSFQTSGDYDAFEEGIRDPNDGQIIVLGPLALTEMACDSPNNVMEQEIEFMSALDQAGRWVITRGDLSLRTSEGLFVVSAVAVE